MSPVSLCTVEFGAYPGCRHDASLELIPAVRNADPPFLAYRSPDWVRSLASPKHSPRQDGVQNQEEDANCAAGGGLLPRGASASCSKYLCRFLKIPCRTSTHYSTSSQPHMKLRVSPNTFPLNLNLDHHRQTPHIYIFHQTYLDHNPTSAGSHRSQLSHLV